MSDRAYRGIYYDQPHVQAEFERLGQRIRDAEQARAPSGARRRQAEREVESGAIAQLRQAEDEGDEKGERGMALGVRFHTANFTFTQPDEFTSPVLAATLSRSNRRLSARRSRGRP